MTLYELKEFIRRKQENTFDLLKTIARTKTIEECHVFGYRSYEQALKGIMNDAMKAIEKATRQYEKENPD